MMLRFTNVDHKPTRLSPVYGYLTHPLLPLRQALEPLLPQINGLDQFIKIAKNACHYPSEHGLSHEESASIYIYTMDWGEQSLYRVLNRILRNEDRSVLVPWHGYLKLFDNALNKLPNVQTSLWRGIKDDVSQNYKAGAELIWWSFNSCSSGIRVIKDFLGPTCTLFMIEAKKGKAISTYSNYPKENEIILGLGTRLRVKDDPLDHSSMNVIHLVELSDANEEELSSTFTNMSVNQPLKNLPCTPIGSGSSIFKVCNYQDGSRYEGEWKNEKRQGKGTYYFSDGAKYTGDWNNDQRTGEGVFSWPDGERYEGEYKDGKKYGKGTFYYNDGSKYTGQWVDDKTGGQGIFTWSNGDRYEGQYRSGKKDGKGTYYYINGNKFIGGWIDDKKEGYGVFTWSDGNKYEGQYKNDKKHGKGTFYFSSGSKYIGDWLDDCRTGQGVFIWSDGDRYEGQYKDDKKNGKGKMCYGDGRVIEGVWSNDILLD